MLSKQEEIYFQPHNLAECKIFFLEYSNTNFDDNLLLRHICKQYVSGLKDPYN
jgi:hypothetical protein